MPFDEEIDGIKERKEMRIPRVKISENEAPFDSPIKLEKMPRSGEKVGYPLDIVVAYRKNTKCSGLTI